MAAPSVVTFDPAGALERLGAELPSLLAARERTRAAVSRRREALAGVPLGDCAAVVLFGSWGRGELTRRSDDDWALLVEGGTPPGAGTSRPGEAAARAAE